MQFRFDEILTKRKRERDNGGAPESMLSYGSSSFFAPDERMKGAERPFPDRADDRFARS